MAEFATLQHATYTEAEWNAWNGILLAGQVAYSSDALYSGTNQMKVKVGNGTDTWTALDYVPEPSSASAIYLTCRNTTGSTISKGKAVYISGANSQYPSISLAKADAEATSRLIGVAAFDIANNTNAANNVLLVGTIENIDTSGFSNGDNVFLSAATAGEITATAPTSPNYLVSVGIVTYSHASNGKISVRAEQPIADNTSLGTSNRVAPSQNAVKSYADAKVGSAMTQAINEAKGSDIASASTTDIGAATGNYVKVTGTTTITALGTIQAGARRIVEFGGVLTLTHNATSLILPTGANITTAAGDVAAFVSLGSGNWRCVNYMRADGSSLAGGTKTYGTEMYAVASGTDTYTASLSPAPSSYTTGMQVRIKIPNANTVTNPTLNLNSLGAKTIKGVNSSALRIGTLYANGDYLFVYDGTDFILQAGIMDRRSADFYKKYGTTDYEIWYTQDPSGTTGTNARAKDILIAMPFTVSKSITLDRIAMEITGAGTAASVVRLGIYADNGNLYPGALVLDAGTIAGDSATFQSITINQTLAPGLYWLCFVHNSAASITFRAWTSANGLRMLGISSTLGATNYNTVLTVSYTYAALPATFTGGGALNVASVPIISVRLSA